MPKPAAEGVGTVSGADNEEPVTDVRGTNGSRRNAIPFRVIPARGQVPENSVEPPNKESCDVFHEDEARSYRANEPSELCPQAGSVPVDSDSLSRIGNVLTREPA